jgi:hypothetical protein
MEWAIAKRDGKPWRVVRFGGKAWEEADWRWRVPFRERSRAEDLRRRWNRRDRDESEDEPNGWGLDGSVTPGMVFGGTVQACEGIAPTVLHNSDCPDGASSQGGRVDKQIVGAGKWKSISVAPSLKEGIANLSRQMQTSEADVVRRMYEHFTRAERPLAVDPARRKECRG